MLGTIINFVAIIVGSTIGLFLKKGISQKLSDTVMNGVSLSVIFLALLNIIEGASSLESNSVLLIIFTMAIGGAIGEALDIDKALNELGNNIEKKLKGRGGKVSEGFVTASLLFCVGAMAVVGALESGLKGQHNLLKAKSVLDCISSIVFTSSLGIGVMLSSITVLVYQGLITICASFLKNILLDSVINNMTLIGSLLIMALGLNMLKATKIKVANLLPAVFLPILYQVLIPIINPVFQKLASLF